ncbi:hypothetical protein ACFX16_002543 [Malus domestica]
MAHIWLTSCCKKGLESYNTRHGHAVFLENLQKYATYKIESNVDKNYGQGFREANMAVTKFGLRETIDYIIRNKTLPR